METITGERGHGSRTTRLSVTGSPSKKPVAPSPPARSTNTVNQAQAAASPQSQDAFMDHCEFRESPVHGYGVFATEDIEAGTEIIREQALWVVDTATALKSTFPETSNYADVRWNMVETFNNSCYDDDPEQQAILKQDIINLCGGFKPESKVKANEDATQILSQHLREILIVNGMTPTDRKKPEYAAVFRGASRLNHSCAPNATAAVFENNNDSIVSFAASFLHTS